MACVADYVHAFSALKKELEPFAKSHPRNAAARSSCSRCMAAATPSPRLTGGAMRRRNLKVRRTT